MTQALIIYEGWELSNPNTKIKLHFKMKALTIDCRNKTDCKALFKFLSLAALTYA